MDARGTCDGRHRARKNCPDPECYLRDPYPATHGEIADAEALEAHEEEPERATEPQPGDPEWWAFARDNPDRAKGIVRDGVQVSAAEMFPIEFGPGIYRWACARDGGYQRTEYAHGLPPAPEGWRWSSALVTAVGGRGKLHVSAAVVDGSEGANAATGPQSLVLEITGRGGYCTSLDVLLFARPAEVRR